VRQCAQNVQQVVHASGLTNQSKIGYLSQLVGCWIARAHWGGGQELRARLLGDLRSNEKWELPRPRDQGEHAVQTYDSGGRDSFFEAYPTVQVGPRHSGSKAAASLVQDVCMSVRDVRYRFRMDQHYYPSLGRLGVRP